MASNVDVLEQVLQKLRKRLLSGEPIVDFEWDYASSNNHDSEDRALEVLQSFNVLRKDIVDMSYKIESSGAIRYDGTTTQSKTIIREFKPSNYEAICIKYGLEPHSDTYIARFSLLDDVLPIVVVGDRQFVFRPMYQGKAIEIIRHCMKSEHNGATLKELREQADIKPLNNVSQVFKDNLFASGRALSPFLTLTPSSVHLALKLNITDKQLALIRSESKTDK